MSIQKLNTQKKVIKNQNYENYWKITLAFTSFFNDQFIRTLAIILNHIDKYDLSSKTINELIKNPNSKRKQFNEPVVHTKELMCNIQRVYRNDDPTGATTRKQINSYIKLGFVKPYLRGYVSNAKQYVSDLTSKKTRMRIFSDTVYTYASFNSSQTNDDTKNNQIKFFVKTLLNLNGHVIRYDNLIGLMISTDRNGRGYLSDKDMRTNTEWGKINHFGNRKYNQLAYLISILKNLNLIKCTGGAGKNKDFMCALSKNAHELLPEKGNTKRDSYRFALMKKEVLEESEQFYNGKHVCFFEHKEAKGLVVSHIYASAQALADWDLDSAYDPNNALLLMPGPVDQSFDKYDMTFNTDGKAIFSDSVVGSLPDETKKYNYHIDSFILNENRYKYLVDYHHVEFLKRHPDLKEKVSDVKYRD